MDELAQGGEIDGRFELQGTLGRGGMGVVYRAIDRERGVEVALKTLRGVSPARVLRFKSEFRALRDLRHPNLVELGELFESGGTWFFTMELVRGRPFLEWVAASGIDVDTAPTSANGPLTAQDSSPSLAVTTADAPPSVVARNLARSRVRVDRRAGPACDVAKLKHALGGLVRGLAALHGSAKVHRDIKPSNILVEDSGRLVLLDFGVVAELHDRVQEGLLFGTARYMAPEQARGDAIAPAADWYAVGVVMFEALTGELPFSEASNDDLLVLKQQLDAPAPSELVDGVPPELDALVRELLARDPEQRPTAASILDALGVDPDDEPVPPLGGGGGELFVGRAAELAQLDAALAASRHATAHVVVEGESGVGKSALVARFVELARAREPRLLVLRGRCHERERVPFNALDGVLDDLARYLATPRTTLGVLPDGVSALLAVFPALRAAKWLVAAALVESTPDDPDVRGRAFAALRELLARLARRRPLAIVLDDTQWADADSTALLAELLRGAPPLCVVETRRPAPGLPLASHVQHVELGGLAARDAEELVRRIGAVDAAHVVAESRGHPLFLRELARHGAAGAAGAAASLEDVIWSRAARLDETARRLLAVVAVTGAPLRRQVACEAAGLTVAEGDPQLAALAAEHLVRVHGPRPHDAVEAFHDRVRGAICAHVPADVQRALHARIARSLEVTGASAGALLAHFEAAGDHDRVSRYLIAAADDARAAFAFGQVATLLRRALADTALAPARRGELLVALADALANDGRTADAARCYLEAAALVPPESEQHLDLLRRAAERFLMSGEVADGLATARAVLARVDMRLPATRARVIAGIVWNQVRMRGRAFRWTPRTTTGPGSVDADVCWSIGAGLGMIDSLLGTYFSGRAARLALAHGTPLQIARGMAAASIGAGLLGRRERAHRLLDAATRAAAEDGTPLAQWYVGLARTGREFLVENQFRRAHESARSLETEWYAAGQGPGWETDVAMHFSLASQQMLGEYRDMARRVARLVERAHRKGDLFQEVTLRVRFAVRHLLDDHADAGRSDVLDALAAWLPGADSFGNQRAWGLWSRTRIELYANRLATLDDELGAEWQRMGRSLVGRLPVMQGEWLHAYATFLLGRAIAARKAGRTSEHAALCRAADRVATRLARLEFPAAACAEWLVRAGTAWVRRDGDVVAVTRRALDEAHRTGVLAFAHATERRLGEALGGDAGAAMIARADAAMRAAGWRDPERAAEVAMPSGRFAE